MFVGILSDTHGVFSDPFKEFFEPIDVLWHAGDFGGGMDFVRELKAFKPLIGVCGNCDSAEIRYDCPLTQLFNCEEVKVLMTHIGGYPGHYPLNVKAMIDAHKPGIFVCGHSHILKVMSDKSNNLLAINPGAAGIQGWQIERTALRIHIDGKDIHDMEVFRLPR